MTIQEALSTLRNIADRLHASGCHWRSERITESANAIEAAMREPVGEAGYAWSSASTSQATHYGVPFVALGEMNVPPGTKLFTFPPSAQAELVRITEQLAERDAEIERLTLQRDAQAENATQWFDRANGREIEVNALRVDNERLRGLLSHWYEMWNDGIPNPDGDVLDDTVAALDGKEGKP